MIQSKTIYHMKTVALFIIGIIVFGVIVIGGGMLLLVLINEERKDTCGKCDFRDPDLNHCWMRGISVGTEDRACVTFSKRTK